MIRAGTVAEARRESGDWAFVDVGFSEKSKSSALLLNDGTPELLQFGVLCERVAQLAASNGPPLNLVVEAPLSVAFSKAGNPTGRSVERRELQRRYWYVGLGCSVLVAAQYLLRRLHNSSPKREIRLFEGLVSFKPKGVVSDHGADVIALRTAVWEPRTIKSEIVPPERLGASQSDSLQSALGVIGLDLGVPPVVVLLGRSKRDI